MVLSSSQPAVEKTDNLYRTDEGQDALIMAFGSGQGRDRDRNFVTRDLCLRSVGKL